MVCRVAVRYTASAARLRGLSVSLGEDIRECQNYADTCARIAARAADAKTRDDILRLRQRWLSLARCLALLPRVDSQPPTNNISAILE
jgi:hypothetical protein